MEEALRAELLTTIRTPTPPGADASKYCRYHQNMGHTTEDCSTLKDKLESLIQAGHLQKFVQRNPSGVPIDGGEAPTHRPVKRSIRRTDRSRSRSQERKPRGVINTISGGFGILARKRHLRSLHSVNQAEIARRSLPKITFSDEDFHAPDPDQDNPMVITAMAARYQVGKVLIDQGSSANILYWKAFSKWMYPKGMLNLFRSKSWDLLARG